MKKKWDELAETQLQRIKVQTDQILDLQNGEEIIQETVAQLSDKLDATATERELLVRDMDSRFRHEMEKLWNNESG